ncbi:50S ribosomal protein L4 [Sulfobacillus acidophilus TPY]|uniref:Large ribosomal subunit protein uL4 n=1 Tax=Sulfobacillus acidophilus (strain ATCC 700253 / DSM 10332 / NAL) TaxID=679936 RepID=G8TXF8_SULAD|nr:50S ribosomal protein L4 [Sulfobacillus acidophilus TPY]AEW03857.1 ribosomal protein L4/L1e [Sulfobacillus acidophilus DSM 10332]
MPNVNVYNLAGEVVGQMELSDAVFSVPANPALLHQVIVAYEANRRAGTAATKTRANVRGGGRKPWRQKGTGRARAGSTRAPHWRHGGVVFGPHPRDYSVRVPQKMRQAAIRQALSEKLRAQELIVVDSLALDQANTKQLVGALDRLNLGRNVMFITREPIETLKLSARNIKDIHATTTQSLDAYSLLRYHRVVLDKNAVEAVEGVFGS